LDEHPSGLTRAQNWTGLGVDVGRRYRQVGSVLPRCLSEPTSTRSVEGALFGVAEQGRDLAQMKPRFSEVSRRLVAALFDEVLASHAFGGQASLQRPRMQRQLVSNGVHTALPGGQESAGQLGHPFRQRRGARQIVGLQVLGGNAPGLWIRCSRIRSRTTCCSSTRQRCTRWRSEQGRPPPPLAINLLLKGHHEHQ
jgi:hypothetical protein